MARCFFDSHAHLDGAEIRPELEAVLSRARDAGVTHMVVIGASDKIAPNHVALEIAEANPNIYAAVGVHPHDASIVDGAAIEEIRKLSTRDKVVAIGETGLDYHYDHSPREKQIEAFRAFIRLARERRLPLVVHTREAEDDTIELLKSEGAAETGGVLHCFTGTEKLARAAIDIGFYVSFSGVLTFRNADPLRAIASWLPRDRVLVETDCPYLSPVPVRGKRNEPSFVVHTAAKLAELWGTSLEDVKQKTGENASRLFRIKE